MIFAKNTRGVMREGRTHIESSLFVLYFCERSERRTMIKAKKVKEETRCKNCKDTGMVQIAAGVRGIRRCTICGGTGRKTK